MGSGSGSNQSPTNTSQYIMSPEERRYIELANPGIEKFAAMTPERYPGSTIAGFNPAQVAGQGLALEAAPMQAGLSASGAEATRQALAFNPESGREAAANAIARPIYRNLTETVLPQIRSEAGGAGQYGGSRQGIAEGIAAGRTAEAASDAIAKMQPELYGIDTRAKLQALGLLPQTIQAQVAPATTVSGVGDVRQAMEQAQLAEQVQNFYWPQTVDLAKSREILALLGAIPRSGQNITTGSVAPNPVTGARVASSALAGAGLGATIGGPIGAGVGALGGAVLPFAFG